MIGYRARRMKMGVKRVGGIAVGSTGLFLLVRYLPPEMWVSLIGLFLIWIGWSWFKH